MPPKQARAMVAAAAAPTQTSSQGLPDMPVVYLVERASWSTFKRALWQVI